VRDYVIYHELSHLREMNHSARFGRQVAEVCPAWRAAECWLSDMAAWRDCEERLALVDAACAVSQEL